MSHDPVSIRVFESTRLEGARFEVLCVGNEAWVKLTNPSVTGFLVYWSREGADMAEAVEFVLRLRRELPERLSRAGSNPRTKWHEVTRNWFFEDRGYWPYNPIPLRPVLESDGYGRAKQQAPVEDLDAH